MEKYIIIFIILIILYFLFFNCNNIDKITNTSTDKLNSDLVDSINNLGQLAKDIQKPTGLTLPASLVVIKDIDVIGSANIKGNVDISGNFNIKGNADISGNINFRSKATIKDVNILTSTYKICTDIIINSLLITKINNIPFKSISRIEIILINYNIGNCFLQILFDELYGTNYIGSYTAQRPDNGNLSTTLFNVASITNQSLIRPHYADNTQVSGNIDLSILSNNILLKMNLVNTNSIFYTDLVFTVPNLVTKSYLQIQTTGSPPGTNNSDNIYVKYYY